MSATRSSRYTIERESSDSRSLSFDRTAVASPRQRFCVIVEQFRAIQFVLYMHVIVELHAKPRRCLTPRKTAIVWLVFILVDLRKQQRSARALSDELIAELQAASVVLIGALMYNFRALIAGASAIDAAPIGPSLVRSSPR